MIILKRNKERAQIALNPKMKIDPNPLVALLAYYPLKQFYEKDR